MVRPTKQINQTTIIIISFPSQYQKVAQSGVTCKTIEDSKSHPCSYSYPDLTITTSSLYIQEMAFNIMVSPILNPIFAETIDPFNIYHYENSNMIQQSVSSGTLEIQPNDMSSASLSTSSLVVAANCTWTLSFTISQSLNSGSTIELITPVWNEGMSANYSRYYCSGFITCIGITGIV